MARVRAQKIGAAFWVLIVVLLGAIAATYLAFGTDEPNAVKQALGVKTPFEQRTQQAQAEFKRDFVTFTDADYGFTFDYPVGYEIQYGADNETRAYIIASTPDGLAESFVASVSKGAFTPDDFKQLVDLYDPQYIKVAKETEINGRHAYVINYGGPNDISGENAFMRQAAVQCTSPDGSQYTAILTAMVPEELSVDVTLSDYLISTFRCAA